MNAAHRMPPESFVEVEDVDDVISLALKRGAGYFSDLWHNQAGSDVARRLLETMARAPGTVMERTEIRGTTRDEASRIEEALRDAVETLLRRDIIEHAGDGCRITVPLVAEYARQQVFI